MGSIAAVPVLAASGTAASFEAVLLSDPVIAIAAQSLRIHVGGTADHDWAGEVRSAITPRSQP